jgi:hypothetical protein
MAAVSGDSRVPPRTIWEGRGVSEEVPSAQTAEEPWFIPRPPILLMDLPFKLRWEVTRRHPYYLRCWHLAHQHHQQPATDPQQRALEEAAVLVLRAIGVSDDPPPPAASAESLGVGSLSRGWESGAVAPVTFRGLAGMLLADLPPEARLELGHFLTASAAPAEGPSSQRHQFLAELHRLRHAAFDASPNRPVVSINVNAPQRVVVQAVEELVRRWKEESRAPERRRRDDKFQDYLAVWDLREGWVSDHYDSLQERTLRQIAQQLKASTSTVANRYRSAFRMIIGCEYTPERWARVLGFLKVAEWLGPEELPRRALLRPWRTPRPRPVPESVLQPPHHDGGSGPLLDVAGASQDEIAYVDLVLDIKTLLALGKDNAAIRQQLELPPSFPDDVLDLLRERHQDLL